ncbi:MAG: arginase family protein [Fidelibacterota bacterium]|nr:MAG: arginase family protein [Candidatus Neomarinimicrobiota bacterium]
MTVPHRDRRKEQIMRNIGLLGVPSSVGARKTGQEGAPQAFRQAGLVAKLQAAGHLVVDFGDLHEAPYHPDQRNPRAQNLDRVVRVNRHISRHVDQIARQDVLPLILGGDCTITLGVLDGLLRHHPDLGLLYFDGDVDLMTPDTSGTGILDGMGMAHILGCGADELARLGPRYPLLTDDRIALYGFDVAEVSQTEADVLRNGHLSTYPAYRIRRRVKRSAARALTDLRKRACPVLVHFDVDVINFNDFPAADVPHYNGLSFRDAMTALRIFLADPCVAGLVLTEFNAERDPEGKLARQLVNGLVQAMNGADRSTQKRDGLHPNPSGPFRMHDVPWVAIR